MKKCFVCLNGCFTSQSTAMVMSGYLGTWNISTMMASARSDRPKRKTKSKTEFPYKSRDNINEKGDAP